MQNASYTNKNQKTYYKQWAKRGLNKTNSRIEIGKQEQRNKNIK